MGTKTILIFDDDVNILEICSIVLEHFGYRVAISETSHNVIERVAEVQPDLVLMDNWIPAIGGVEATRLLKAHPIYHAIPVIFSSANLNLEKLAQDAGADTFLEKPFDLDVLESTVKKMLA
ncbi:response regulator [Sphingobacterium prati]|uniref:response regulator n=1 Tax=Sphingobacterium prati TaxID=2737006 RepID=UPI0015569AA5|nr:response regulator [Sphingobacterium prati]NPE46117.1 response regulator [Sphingobacterium prati]